MSFDASVEAPRPPASPTSRAITALAFVGLGAFPFLLWTWNAPLFAILALVVVAFAVALATRAYEAGHAALITALTLAIMLTPRLAALWPLPSVVTLVVYGVVARFVPGLRASARFAVRGKLDRTTAVLAISFVVLAATALVIWRFTSGVDMTRYRAFIPPRVPTWLVFVLIVPFAMLNAIYEEVIWRAALWEGSRAAFGPTATLVLTSVSFGIAHYHGFPSGFVGMGLATIYGLMMGVLRQRTGGLLWPWAAHVLADVVIFMLVAAMIV